MQELPYDLKLFVSGHGAPVVMLHGLVSTHIYLEQVSSAVAQKRTTYVPDLLGFGASPRPSKAAYSVAQHIDSLHKTLSERGPKSSFVLYGHSMGAQLALAYAAKYPDNITHVVISGLPQIGTDKQAAYLRLGELHPGQGWLIDSKRARLMYSLPKFLEPLAGWIASRTEGRYSKRILKQAVRFSWYSYSRSRDNVVVAYEPDEDLKKIKVPVHFVFGEDDPLSLDPKTALGPFLKPTDSLLITSGGHNQPLTHPQVIIDQILQV